MIKSTRLFKLSSVIYKRRNRLTEIKTMSLRWMCVFVGFAGLFMQPSSTQAKECWDTTWYNSSHPSKTNRSDIEQIPSADTLDSIRNTLCPGGTLKARCKDEKGEPFTGDKNDTASHFFTTCDVSIGISCQPYASFPDQLCPDLAINFGCDCSDTTSVGAVASTGVSATTRHVGSVAATGAPATTVASASTVAPGSTANGVTGNGNGSGGNGVSSVAGSIVVIFICALCFMI